MCVVLGIRHVETYMGNVFIYMFSVDSCLYKDLTLILRTSKDERNKESVSKIICSVYHMLIMLHHPH